MPSTYTHIGEAIRARRETLGLTQKDLCQRLGWKQSRVSELSEIENGKNTNLTLDRIEAFAEALNCHAGDLVFMLKTDRRQILTNGSALQEASAL